MSPPVSSATAAAPKVRLAPITSVELPAVAAFLHHHLNPRVPTEHWVEAVQVPWGVHQPDHGFFLARGEQVVGAYLAYYSRRRCAGGEVDVCNLGAWCVLDEHRHQGLRLLTTLLKRPGYQFTDFSPSGNVPELNRRLKFTELDTTTSLLAGAPWSARPGVRVSGRLEVVEATVDGEERRLYEDHRATAAARHLVVRTRDDHCYVVFRRDARKGVRAFGSVLHVSNRALFRRYARQVAGHLLRHHGIPAMLVEHGVVGGAPLGGAVLRTSRPKMIKGDLDPRQVDYLYSELTCLRW